LLDWIRNYRDGWRRSRREQCAHQHIEHVGRN
jgi:hypothetical protein